jgi:hypothetical protein
MILFNFELNIPKIKCHTHDKFKTTVITLGFCRVMVLNKHASNIFLFVSGLALTDFDRVMRYSDYEQQIQDLQNQLAEYQIVLNNNLVKI